MSENTEQEKAVSKVKGPCIILAGAGTGKTYTIRQKIKYIVDNNIYNPEEILCLTFSNEATNNLKDKISKDLGVKSNNIVVKTFHSFCSEVIQENSDFFKITPDFKIIVPDDSKVLIHKYLKIDPYWSNRYISSIQKIKDYGIKINQIQEYITENIENKLKEYTKLEDLDEFYNKKQQELRTIYKDVKSEDKDIRKISKEQKKEIKRFISLYEDYIKFSRFIKAFIDYENLKKERNFLDYGDLNQMALEYFKEKGSEKYNQQYKYVFIDEFQDTNKLQFDLISYLAVHRNITVVGDLNQSIYGFRGAYKDSFEQFIKNFEVDREKDIFRLEKSYRSPNTILDLSYNSIKNNYDKDSKECIQIKNFEDRSGKKIKLNSLKNQYEEARYITEEIIKKIEEENIPLNEIAVLIRTHKQAEIIKQALELKGIPYIYQGKTNLLEYPEIKTVVAFLSILNNLKERKSIGDQSFWYMFHYKNTLDPKDSYKIGRYLKKHRKENKELTQVLLESSVELSQKGKKIIKNIINTLRKLAETSNKPLPKLILDIYELSGVNKRFSYKRNIENTEHLLNLKKFYEISKNFYEMHSKNYSDFIEYLEILDKLDVNIQAENISNKNAIKLMTIHACKGLEFNTVFLTNLAENRFPITRTPNEPLIPKELIPDRNQEIEKIKKNNPDLEKKELEKLIKENIKNYEKKIFLNEERRLFYVAVTRTKVDLYITFARSYNSVENSARESVFLQEINYQNNPNIEFLGEDNNNLSTIIAPDTKIERYKQNIKEQLIDSLDTDDISSIILRLSKYFNLRENNPEKINNLEEKIKSINLDKQELEDDLIKYKENKNNLVFNKEEFTFSPSAINTYLECPKKFELRHIYQMPEIGSLDELLDLEHGRGSALDKGSYVHKILEIFVKEHKKTEEDLEEIAKDLLKTDSDFLDKISEDDYKEAIELSKVFLKRHKQKLEYIKKAETEMPLNFTLEDYKFYGIADRVDFLTGPLSGFVDIIDYKTNKISIDPHKRKIQLGFYAIGLMEKGYKVNKLVLDMLKLESPVEMIVDKDNQEEVSASLGCNRTSNFKISELKQEILDTCKSIENDYKTEFKTLRPEEKDKCRNCGYKFYCPLWKEEMF